MLKGLQKFRVRLIEHQLIVHGVVAALGQFAEGQGSLRQNVSAVVQLVQPQRQDQPCCH